MIAGATVATDPRVVPARAVLALALVSAVGLPVHRADRAVAVEIVRARRVPAALPERADAVLTVVQIEDPTVGQTSGAKHRSCNRCLKFRWHSLRKSTASISSPSRSG
jgi:hypothetical protein